MSASPEKKPEPPKETKPVETDSVSQLTAQLMEIMEGFQKVCPINKHFTAKTRKRLHGAGMKSLSFIVKTFEIAGINPDLAPHFLDVKLLDVKLRRLTDIMSLKAVLAQFAEVLETAYLVHSDDCYHNALLFYDSVKEAMKMRVDAAEAPFKTLQPYFKSRGKNHPPRKPT